MPFGAAAAASIVGGGISALGAKSAAKTQAAAADRSAEMQLGMFNTIRGDLSPFRDAGLAALPGYHALLGIGAPPTAFSAGAFGGGGWEEAYLSAHPDLMAEASRVVGVDPRFPTRAAYAQWHRQNHGEQEGRQFPGMDAQAQPQQQFDSQGMQRFLENTPGYQFARDQGMQAVTNRLNAQGLGGVSGAFGKGLARFVTGLADQTYQQQLTNYGNAAGMGQSAANQTGTFGQAATTGATNALQGGAAASAAGTVGATNAISGGITSAGNALLTSKILGMYAPALGGA